VEIAPAGSRSPVAPSAVAGSESDGTVGDRTSMIGTMPTANAPVPAEAVLAVRGVTKRYGESTPLQRLDASFSRGRLAVVTGPSGSGKSTLLRLIAGLDHPDAGRIVLFGEDLAGLDREALAGVRSREVGIAEQARGLVPDLDVRENVELPLRFRTLTAGERRRRVDHAIDQVGLGARMHALPEELSGGQQQRVAIARALVGEPRVLLADEPTGNLDSQMARRILEILEAVNRTGVTVIMVTHAPELAARAHRKLHILDGRAIDPLERRRAAAGAAGPWKRDA